MTDDDQFRAHFLGRLYMIEGALRLLLVSHPYEAMLKAEAKKLLQIASDLELFQSTSDVEQEIFQSAREKSFRAMFGEADPK